jgi:hypothetical protein
VSQPLIQGDEEAEAQRYADVFDVRWLVNEDEGLAWNLVESARRLAPAMLTHVEPCASALEAIGRFRADHANPLLSAAGDIADKVRELERGLRPETGNRPSAGWIALSNEVLFQSVLEAREALSEAFIGDRNVLDPTRERLTYGVKAHPRPLTVDTGEQAR